MSELTITSELIDGATVLRLVGAASIAASSQMEFAMTRAIAARPSKVIVDMSGVTDISSLMAGELISLQNGLKQHGGRAVIAGPSDLVRTAFERMRIGAVLPIFASVEEALQAKS